MATLDLSFISVTKVLPAVVGVLQPSGGAQLVLLIKPQFEAGRAQVSAGGVVRDPKVRQPRGGAGAGRERASCGRGAGSITAAGSAAVAAKGRRSEGVAWRCATCGLGCRLVPCWCMHCAAAGVKPADNGWRRG
jgi:hypothetical protein